MRRLLSFTDFPNPCQGKKWLGKSIHFVILTVCTGVFGVFLLCSDHVHASPVLAVSDCKTLRAQKSALAIMGMSRYFKKGLAWVKKNLKEEDVYLLKNYIRIEEYIRFRCPAVTKSSTADNAKKAKPVQ